MHRFKQGLRPADQGAGHRHDRDRRRRRLDRRRSTRSGCCASARIPPAPIPARPATARGGTEPTVTDANLVLGYYDPGFFLGGRMALDRKAARRARRRHASATPLGLSVERGGLGHPQGRDREHGRGRARPSGREGQGPAPLRHGRLRRRRAGACRRRGARAGRARGDHSAGLGRRLGAGLPRRAAVASSWCARIRCAFARGLRRRARSTRCWRSWRPKAGARLAEAGVAAAAGHGRAHAPTCGWSARCTRSPCRCRPARSTDGRSAAIRDRLRGRLHRALHLALWRAPRSRRSTSASACSARRPTLSLTGAAGGGDAAASARARASAWFGDGFVEAAVYDRYALRAGRHDRRPGDHRGARGDHHRAARRQRARSTTSCNLRIAIGVAAPAAARWSRRACRSPRRWRGSRPIRSRSRSCGAASSPWSRRCG